jgi:hypothetical protein
MDLSLVLSERLQRLAVRAGRPGLEATWRYVFMAAARLTALLLGAGSGASVYLRGPASGWGPMPGLSDVDLVVIASQDPERPGAAPQRLRRRWAVLRRLTPLGLVVDEPRIHGREEVPEIARATALTYGLETPRGIPAGGLLRPGRDA